MIGRHSDLTVYKEIFKSNDFIKIAFGGMLIPLTLGISKISGNSSSRIISILLLISVVINGLPIIMEAFQGLMKKKINVDDPNIKITPVAKKMMQENQLSVDDVMNGLKKIGKVTVSIGYGTIQSEVLDETKSFFKEIDDALYLAKQTKQIELSFIVGACWDEQRPVCTNSLSGLYRGGLT